MFTTEFIANSELQTAYHDLGSGTPFLMVHGFTGSKLDFISQAAWFVEGHRVILYDQRGHGESSNAHPYHFDQLVDDLVGLLDALDIPTCHLLGHSLGGMVAMRAVLQHPQRFRSLVLMDTAATPLGLFGAKVRQQIGEIVLSGGCQALMEVMQGQQPNRIAQRGIDFLGEAEHWRRIRVKLEQMDPQAWIELTRVMDEHEPVLADLPQINIPTTVIVGQHDKPFIKPSRQMNKAIPHSRLVKIPKSAHSPQYENADVWRDAVLAHLAWAE